MSTKKCVGCNKTFPKTNFEGSNANGKFSRKFCKNCLQSQRNKNKSKSPEAYLRHLYSHLKHSRHASTEDLVWEIEVEDLLSIWEAQNGRCALTGLLMTYHKDGNGKKDLNASIDRIDPEIWYIPSNIQLVCSRVNVLKHNLSEDLLYWWAKNIVEFKEND